MNENNANFTPAAPNFKTLVKMSFQGLTNFPYIEEDFDALTNYGLLSKVVEYLNEVISNNNEQNTVITNLYNAYISLQNYVNDYFDNLDVQDEINNKLDEMSIDGTLTNIIKNYVDPIYQNYENEINNEIDNQNNRIDNIQSQLLAVESGSPLTATSTSEMTNTEKVYVNTTDGNWYYYDGDSWEIGGVYQGVNLSEKSVHYNNLDDELQDSIQSVETVTDIYQLTDGYVNANGNVSTGGDNGYYEFTVTPFDTYELNIRVSGSSASTWVCIQFLNNSTVISNILQGDLTVENNYYNTIITIPYNANKIRINTFKFGSTVQIGNYINKVNKYEVNNVSKRQLDSNLQSFFNNQYEEVNPTEFISGGLYTTYQVSSYAQSTILSLDVNPNETYRITGKQVYNNPLVIFTTNNKISSFTIDGNTYPVNNYVEYIKDSQNDHVFTDYEFIVPKYCSKLYFNKYNNDSSFKVEKCTSYKINASDVYNDINKIGFNKIIAIGDSITEVNYRALHNYLYWIKNDISSLTIQNLGASGTGYYNAGGSGTNRYVNRISSIESYDLDDDIVIVMGSVNDISGVSQNLGQLGDTTTSTIYGSIYSFFNTLFNNFNGVRVGCISPINWKNSNTEDVNLYLKAIEDTCKLFNVPYLDLFHSTNLRPNNDSFLNEYYVADGIGSSGELDTNGVHPNSNGHKLFYGRIKEFINTL